MTQPRLPKLAPAIFAIFIACIDEQKSRSDAMATDATISDTRSDVDTGGLTCGKCSQVWDRTTELIDGQLAICFTDTASDLRCCPTLGDCCFEGPDGCCAPEQGTCPKGGAGYEWRECSDVREAFGRAYCIDADAYAGDGEVSERGSACVEQSLGCEALPPAN